MRLLSVLKIFACVFLYHPTTHATSVAVVKGDFSQGFNDAFIECRQHFYEGVAPMLIGDRGKKLNQKIDALCFDGFAVLHSGVSRTPLWSAEYLTRTRIEQARKLVRKDSFRVETRLPHDRRAGLSDYSRSGFDRGHLAPNGDMADANTQYESFSLANIAPQNGTHNRNIWRHIESITRRMTMQHGRVYVVTGVVFDGHAVSRIGGRVLVPSHFFKAIYIPSLNQAGVYYSPNAENSSHEIISLAELAHRTGIDAMPNLPASVQNSAKLPRLATDGTIMPDKPKDSLDDINLNSIQGWVLLLIEIFKYMTSALNK
ncbi:DNA/RNA non-specific endonuclease [Moraxella sp. Tifton1]|uniref:DNA/RNA non-specific endonuclease n=1 Tax=Moraxella oculi TaxID=2940516 RepID=UPI002011ABED|nr:DNA/RNA non-specific endonuclease [Moraxella sp. Tifton1]MCL1623273.1 DNA/RNA non-specific endonuclease [Moraxella sp. Tifton1]